LNSSSRLSGLAALEQRLSQDLAWLELPAKPWVIPRQSDQTSMLDVAIIGAGMAGMAAATALKLMGISARLFDRAESGQEGPWVTTARMQTLRSPKQLTGPALGLPALTFRAWFEAQFGQSAWEAMDKIPRTQWMDYLRWYRQVMGLDIQNQHEILSVDASEMGFIALKVRTPKGIETLCARRVVVATGRDGLGSSWVPDLAHSLPTEKWAHSSDVYDYQRLRGLRVGVVGAGASAMDSAATALEAGAARVDLFIRRAELPRINKGKGAGNPGLVHGYYDLPDPWKWRFRRYINKQQVPPPRGSTLRVSRFANAHFRLASPILSVDSNAAEMTVHTPKMKLNVDFLVFATGFRANLSARSEFSQLAPHIKLWKHHFSPDADDKDPELGDYPVLGPAFEFQPLHFETPSATKPLPSLSRVHCFCYPAVASHGQVSGDIPAVSDGAQRLARGIAALFYRENVDAHYGVMESYADPELFGDEWKPE
jgi:FAD-dependent urate hydroxylase